MNIIFDIINVSTMKLEHVAIYAKDLEAMRTFFMRYFNATSNEMYNNPLTGLRTYFLSFDNGARLEIMSRPDVVACDDGNLRTGYAHVSFSTERKEEVDRLTEILRNDGYNIVSGPRTTGDGYYESCIEGPEGCLIEITETTPDCERPIKIRHNINPESFTTISIKKESFTQVEYRDGQYRTEKHVSEQIFEFEELCDPCISAFMKLWVRYRDFTLEITGTNFKWIEDMISRYEEIYDNPRTDHHLIYKKQHVKAVLFEFNGYTGLHKDSECKSIKQQFEILYNTEDLTPYSNYIGEVPHLKRFSRLSL